MSPLISASDEPNQSRQTDTLNMRGYADALARFILHCETPLTVGIQGEFGSGKSSLLLMVQESIAKAEIKSSATEETISGSQLCKMISLNTWEHSLFKTEKECLVSILREITNGLRVNVACEAEMERVGRILDSFLKSGQDAKNSLKDLKISLEKLVSALISGEKHPYRRLLIFIDDLERVPPELAVRILEFLKNSFSLQNCVFIVAMDYQIVVEGLKERFGKPTQENEWQFKAFFERLVQLPFQMPQGSYHLENYLFSLLTRTSFFTHEELKKLPELSHLIRLSLGANPRSLKKLANSLSLINLYQGGFSRQDSEGVFLRKSVLLSLVCIQISFPKIYELLMLNPVFPEWDDDFALKATRGEGFSDDMEQALAIVRQTHEIDFDETWEQALFKIVWSRNWQRNRVIEISRVLSVIKDDLFGPENSSKLAPIMIDALRAACVTSISTEADSPVLQPQTHLQDQNLQTQAQYWIKLKSVLAGAQTLFSDIPEGNSSIYLARKDHQLPTNTQFVLSLRARPFCRFESICGEAAENFQLFSELESKANMIEEIVGEKVIFNLDENSAIQCIDVVLSDQKFPKRGMICDLKDKQLVSEWIQAQGTLMPRFELAIRKALEVGVTEGQMSKFRQQNAAVLNEDFAIEVQTTTGA